MNAVEIEEAISQQADQAFDPQNFPYAFLEAFGNKETTTKRLRAGASNRSDLGGVLQTNNIHIVACDSGEVSKTIRMKIATKAKIDPDLLAHIRSAMNPSSQVAAVVKLRPKDPQALTLPPVGTRRVAENVLDRVRQKLREREQDYSVLDLLGAFNLVAPANFILELLKQPEVASAFSPEGDESACILPRNVKEVHLKAKKLGFLQTGTFPSQQHNFPT